MLLRDAENAALMGFGAAVPNVALLPIEKLHRAYLTVARREAETHGPVIAFPPDVAKAYAHTGLVLLCSSFSKTLSPGYRVGWIADGRFQAEVELHKFSSTMATSTPAQYTIAEMLANGGYDHHLRKVRRSYACFTSQMAQAIGGCFPVGTRVSRPQGGFVLWVECPPTVDTLELYRLALKDGMTIAPGPIFTAQIGYRNFLRLNAAYWSENALSALQTLGERVRSLA